MKQTRTDTNAPRSKALSARLALGAAAMTVAALGSAAHGQTLAQFAPANALFAVELNDLAGARKTAGAFVRQFETSGLLQQLYAGAGLSASDQKVLAGYSGFLDREGLVALYVGSDGQPHYLLAARPAANQSANVAKLTAQTVAGARANKERVQTLTAGGLPYYVTGTGGSAMAYGYSGGLAYASDSANTLAAFLKGTKGGAGLASSAAYKQAMDPVGTGNLRLFLDFKATGGLVKTVLGASGEVAGDLKTAPLVNALSTLGRFGTSYRVTARGLESASFLVPSTNSGDPALAALLTPKGGVKLNAAAQVPATGVLSFSTSSADVKGYYNYLSGLVDRTGLNKGGLTPLFTQALGVDLNTSLLSWLGTEFASVTFAGAKTKGTPTSADALLGSLGEGAYYLAVTDENAARAGLAKLIPKLTDLGGQVADAAGGMAGLSTGGAGTKKPLATSPKPATSSTVTVNGTSVTRYPLGGGVSLNTAIKNKFLILTLTDSAMKLALAGGPKLTDAASYKAALAAVPAGALGYGYTDTARTLQATGGVLNSFLGLALSQGANLRPSDANKVAASITKLINFTASRTGTSVSWTQTSAGGTLTKTIQPVRW